MDINFETDSSKDGKKVSVGGQYNVESAEVYKTKVYVKGKTEISVKW